MSSEAPTPAPSRPTNRGYKWTMRFLGLLYLAAGLVFFFFPNELIYLINVGPQVFKITEPVPAPAEHFWIVLATAEMATLCVLAFLSAETPAIRGYVLAQLLCQVVAAAGFATLFLNEHRYFAYLVGAAINVLISLIIVWSLFKLIRIERTSR